MLSREPIGGATAAPEVMNDPGRSYTRKRQGTSQLEPEVIIPANAGNPARQFSPVEVMSSSENSSNNAWNWNNSNWNNNNSVFFVRDSGMRSKDSEVTLDDIYMAYEECARRKRNTKEAKEFERDALFNCQQLMDEINNRTYKLQPSKCFVVSYPRKREVFCASFRDRVVQHFIYRELNPVIDKLLIHDTCSCRKGKGTDYAIDRVKRKLRQETENYSKPVWVMKIDLSNFFMSLNREWLYRRILDVIKRHYKGPYPETLEYLVGIIILTDVTKNTVRLMSPRKWDSLPKSKSLFGSRTGLPIGNITSQLFANYALNDIDHFIKSRHKSYVRYVDDMVLIDESKEKLLETLRLVEKGLNRVGLRVNNRKSYVQRSEFGISFLGVTVKPYYAVLGKQRISRIYRTGKELKTPEDAYKSISSRKGMFTWYKGWRLAHRWMESLPQEVTNRLTMTNDCRVIHKNIRTG